MERVTTLFGYFAEIAEELDLSKKPDDASAWMEAEMRAYELYNGMDAWRLGRLTDDDMERFREMIVDWARERLG